MTGGRELYLGHSSLPYLSALRIYLPANFFTEVEQRHIRASAPSTTNRLSADFDELHDSLERLVRPDGQIATPAVHERVRSLQMNDDTAVVFNISQTRLRSAMALNHLLTSETGAKLSELTPLGQSADYTETPDAGSIPIQTRTSNWGIPLAWFVIITDSDRTEVVESKDKVITVRVQVPLSAALSRLDDAHSILQAGAAGMDFADDVASLLSWLSSYRSFDKAVVELDYGPVADRVYPDESPSDVHLGLEALAEGDSTAAAAAYRRLLNRWLPIRQLSRAN